MRSQDSTFSWNTSQYLQGSADLLLLLVCARQFPAGRTCCVNIPSFVMSHGAPLSGRYAFTGYRQVGVGVNKHGMLIAKKNRAACHSEVCEQQVILCYSLHE